MGTFENWNRYMEKSTIPKRGYDRMQANGRFLPSIPKGKEEREYPPKRQGIKILRLQAEGLSVETIAKQLGLSKAGVKYYNQETYKKLGVNNKTAAVAEARNRRLL